MSEQKQATIKRRGGAMSMTKEMFEALAESMFAGPVAMDAARKRQLENQAEVEPSSEVKKIIIPENMTKLQAAEELERQWDDEEQEINMTREYEGWDYKDVLVAIKKASESHFGWIQGKIERSFFGDRKPYMIQIVTDIVNGTEVTEECFYGQMTLSAFENATMNVNITRAGSVVVTVDGKKKYNKSCKDFFDLVDTQLRTQSIYRGKSVAIRGSHYGGVEYHLFENHPSDKIFFNENQQSVINSFIIPEITEGGKRCYLFTGDYGTGKTEEAMRIGKHATNNGMSFIYLKDSRELSDVLVLAKNYSPCLLFLEDIDEIASGERGADINSILNTLDGVETKNNDIKIIFTTNHEEKINSAFRRPGRIDLIVRFDYPDAKTKGLIVDSWCGHFKGWDKINLEEGVNHFPDAQGAVIAEISKRIARLATLNDGVIEQNMFKVASLSIEPQVQLMRTQAEEKPSTFESAFREMLQEFSYDTSDRVLNNLYNISSD